LAKLVDCKKLVLTIRILQEFEPTMYDDLCDKVVLITGGANGIGEAMVRAFAANGSHVHFCDIDSASGKALCAEVGGQVTFDRLDLAKEKEIRRWVERVTKQEGRIDVLINSAARDPRIAFDKMTVEEWDQLFALNLRAYFIASQSAVRHMPKSGGAIVNFSSITCHLAPAEMAAYVATKMGIQGLTRSLARELGPRRIRVNTLSPGWIMTDRQLDEHVTPAVKRQLKKDQCIPDLLQPDEIAEVALFLASRASRALTGQEILADRGWAHS
jgi:NAD(P)-dependent dehydrogenase (short-subunit alcohol dehydrogenase family)